MDLEAFAMTRNLMTEQCLIHLLLFRTVRPASQKLEASKEAPMSIQRKAFVAHAGADARSQSGETPCQDSLHSTECAEPPTSATTQVPLANSAKQESLAIERI
eukprot:3376974-Pyramimonas_sp.AAC.1